MHLTHAPGAALGPPTLRPMLKYKHTHLCTLIYLAPLWTCLRWSLCWSTLLLLKHLLEYTHTSPRQSQFLNAHAHEHTHIYPHICTWRHARPAYAEAKVETHMHTQAHTHMYLAPRWTRLRQNRWRTMGAAVEEGAGEGCQRREVGQGCQTADPGGCLNTSATGCMLSLHHRAVIKVHIWYETWWSRCASGTKYGDRGAHLVQNMVIEVRIWYKIWWSRCDVLSAVRQASSYPSEHTVMLWGLLWCTCCATVLWGCCDARAAVQCCGVAVMHVLQYSAVGLLWCTCCCTVLWGCCDARAAVRCCGVAVMHVLLYSAVGLLRCTCCSTVLWGCCDARAAVQCCGVAWTCCSTVLWGCCDARAAVQPASSSTQK